MHLADSHRRAQIRRFYEQRVLQGTLDMPSNFPWLAAPPATQHCDVLYDRQSGITEEPLHDVLVHASGRAKHPCTDVRNVSELQQSLDRPVLAKRAMKHRKNNVDVDCTCGGMHLRRIGFEWHQGGMVITWNRRHNHAFALCQNSGCRGGLRVSGTQVTRLPTSNGFAFQQAFGMSRRDPAALFGNS